MKRRDLIVGASCALASGVAYALEPRKSLSRLGATSLESVTPRRVRAWTARDVSGLAPPSTADDLIVKLYDQLVERVYRHPVTGEEIMMLLARGARQTNELQLHRPEECYPAFGYSLIENQACAVPLALDVALPARRLLAAAPGLQESVLYWTRIGDSLPTSYAGQRWAMIRSASEGYVCDGLLARFSVAGSEATRAFASLQSFVPIFLGAVADGALPGFIGAGLARAFLDKRLEDHATSSLEGAVEPRVTQAGRPVR